MNRWLTILAGALATTLALTTGLAFGQSKPADCQSRAKAPERVEGQVVNVDQAAGRVTVRDKSGTTHEFQANQETLQDMKKGDRIEATLREAPKC
ncbi:MAG: hypothetical protein DME04_21645 [Candidatus Rokuibacteriota bacterium]|nr:MAG: hypothetical protein DME04_21645 [Candidatus Rokubacteria bacterium]